MKIEQDSGLNCKYCNYMYFRRRSSFDVRTCARDTLTHTRIHELLSPVSRPVIMALCSHH
jgi:hypothetical protein